MSFVAAAPLADVPDGGALAVEIDGQEIALVRDGGDVYAIRDECSHASIPLSEGDVEGCEIECWLHGSRFDIRTGQPSGPPAIVPIAVHTVKIEGDDVYVALKTQEN